MSEERPHGATTIHGSKDGGAKGGGAAKWLIGAAAAVALAGGGYYAWKTYGPSQDNTQSAYNDAYSDEAIPADASDQDLRAQTAASYDSDAAPASADTRAAPASADARSAAPARRSTARAAAPEPETTIGITPINATIEESATTDSDEVYVTAPRTPVWASTPSSGRLSAFYPVSARERGREGEARLHCTVQDGGALDCVRVEETSDSFGHAALQVSRTLRHASTLPDGSAAAGSPVNLRVVFRLEDEQRRG